MIRALPAPLAWPRLRLPLVIYLILGGLAAAALTTEGRWFAPLFLIPALWGMWGIVVSGSLLRLTYIGTGASDNMLVVDAARERVLDGLSPYGHAYAESVPPGSPYAYGPLMLLDSIPLEIAASIGILILLAWFGKPWTLALAAGLPYFLALTSSGNTDMLPTVLLTAGLLFGGPWAAVLLGLAVTVKPYVAVFLPLASSFPIALGVASLGYLPALWWGGLVDSMTMLTTLQGGSWLRYAAIPLALGAFRWPLFACVSFVALTMTGQVWSLGYLIPLVVVAGLLVE